ncbi:MAG: S-adenosylmethionine decarboxylase [Candidatus Margulisiibacteriota bacterium]
MSLRKGFGPHLMIDLFKCSVDALDSLNLCFDFLDQLPDKIGMTKITMPHVFPYEGLVPEDRGITGAVIIAESHITVHTFPLKSYAFIDIFSCKPFDTDMATQFCVDYFSAKEPDVHLTLRGKNFANKAVLHLG